MRPRGQSALLQPLRLPLASFAAAACLFGLAGCAVVGPVLAPAPTPPPPPQGIRSVAPTFLEELIVRRKVDGVTLGIYNTGGIFTRGGAVSSMKSWSARVRLDVPVFLIRHPQEGLILFDTGLSTRTAEIMRPGLLPGFFVRFEARPGHDIASQLRAGGVNPGDVKWVILSHAHFDHAGDVENFPGATFVISGKERDAQESAHASRKKQRGLNLRGYENRLNWRFVDFDSASPFGAFDHGVDLFGDGSLFLVDLRGHTPGSMGAWVNLDGGPILLLGDAAWVVDNYMDLALPVKQAICDLDAYWKTIHRVRAMQEAVPRLVVFPGHDLTPRTLTTRTDLPLISPAQR